MIADAASSSPVPWDGLLAPASAGPLLSALGAMLLAALRLAPVTMLSPLLGGPLAPPLARAGLALGLGGIAATLVGARAPGGLAFVAGALREAALGLALAVAITAPVEAARAAGRLADTFRGATLAELHVAPIRQRESACGDLLAHLVIVLAAWAGADRMVLAALLHTFAVAPPGAAALGGTAGGGPAVEVALRAAAELVAAAVAVSAPAAAGVLAADLALSLVARVAPQLGAVNAAQPARAALGLLALAAAASAAAGRLVAAVAESAPLAVRAAGGAP